MEGVNFAVMVTVLLESGLIFGALIFLNASIIKIEKIPISESKMMVLRYFVDMSLLYSIGDVISRGMIEV